MTILIKQPNTCKISSQIKRLKQWEEEKSVLEEGLKATKVAYEWYKLRLEGVSERLRKGPEPSSTPAANTEAMQVPQYLSCNEFLKMYYF